MTTTTAPLTVGTIVRIVKGCLARGLRKGFTCRLEVVQPMGRDYSHMVKIRLCVLDTGKAYGFWARHVNRLTDPVVALNDGNPNHKIQVRKV